MKNDNYYSIQDAFKSLDVLLEEKQEAVFSVNSVKEMEEADQFLKDVENSEELEVIVDPDAVDEEDLKDSYVGYVILRCNTCGTPIFKPEEEVRFEEEVFDAEEENNTEAKDKTDVIVNEEDECPHCHNTDGYTIVGKVAPFEKPEEETIKEEEPEVEKPVEEPQEPTPDIDVEEVEEKEEVKESLTEGVDISPYDSEVEIICKKIANQLGEMGSKEEEDIYYDILHDVNNLRGAEWLEVIEPVVDAELVDEFKKLIKYEDAEVEESCKLNESDEEKIWIIYGDKEKDARANKPVQINKKDLDQYKEVYHFVEVVDSLDSLEEATNSNDPMDQFYAIMNDNELFDKEGPWGLTRASIALYAKHKGEIEWDSAWHKFNAQHDWDDQEPDGGSIGCKLAEYVADWFYEKEGGVGPFGGEKPETWLNRLYLKSQGPEEIYDFYDDGGIFLINISDLVFDADWADIGEDPVELYDYYSKAFTIEELLESDLCWWHIENKKEFLDGYNRIVHDDWYNDDDYVLDEAKKQKEPKPLPKRAVEKECEVCPNCEEEKTLNENKVAFDTLNAENVNILINKYLKETYDNVDTYELKSINNDNAKYYCEGIIKFKSGKEKASRFIFENAKYLTRGKVVLNGLNETFSKSSKAFQLKGTIQENIFNAESLTYQYNAKNLNESVKVFGKVKN